MWFAGGFHWMTIKGRRALPAEAPILTLAPHSSYFDAIPVTMTMASIVMKAESKDIPLWGSKWQKELLFASKRVHYVGMSRSGSFFETDLFWRSSSCRCSGSLTEEFHWNMSFWKYLCVCVCVHALKELLAKISGLSSLAFQNNLGHFDRLKSHQVHFQNLHKTLFGLNKDSLFISATPILCCHSSARVKQNALNQAAAFLLQLSCKTQVCISKIRTIGHLYHCNSHVHEFAFRCLLLRAARWRSG